MTTTEIKKALYKQKPEARFSFIRKGVAYYYADIEEQKVQFGDPELIHESPLKVWTMPIEVMFANVEKVVKSTNPKTS